MTKALVLLVGLALAGVAQAQIKCWTSADGKRGCGDLPPPGARLDAPKGGAPAPRVPTPAATETKKVPSVSALQEQDNRRRQVESQKAAARAAAEKVPDSVKVQRCEQAQESLRQMKGGGRSKRTDAVKARKQEAENC